MPMGDGIRVAWVITWVHADSMKVDDHGRFNVDGPNYDTLTG